MSTQKQFSKIIIGFLVVQAIIRLTVSIMPSRLNESFGIDDFKTLWRKGNYTAITQLQPHSRSDLMWQQASKLKLGNIDARTGLIFNSPGNSPDRRNTILKAGYLKSKDGPRASENTLAALKTEDRALSSLILALRASLFCDQKERATCATLSENSIQGDPLAPIGRGIKGVALRQLKQYNEAKLAFAMYESLSGVESDNVRFNRGIVYFYTKDRALSTGNLNSVIDNPLYSFDARIFLGRNAYELKDLGGSKIQFLKAKEINSTGSATPYIRLGRIFALKKDYGIAMEQYKQGYDLFPNNLELIIDMLKTATAMNDQALITELKNSINSSVGSNSSNFELVGRTYRELKEYQLSENYIRKGITLLPLIEDPLQQKTQAIKLKTQLHHLLITQIYRQISQNINSSAQYLELKQLNINSGQVAFMEGLELLIKGNKKKALAIFSSGGLAISDIDTNYILSRYNAYIGKYNQAIDILKTIKDNQGQEVNKMRCIRAIGMLQGNEELVIQSIQQLQSLHVIDGGYKNSSDLWTYAYKNFQPRVPYIVEYLE